MAKLVKILKGQSVTEQIDSINTNVENINEEIKGVVNNDKGYITANDIPVKSVQGKTGDVSLSAKDVEAFPNSSTIQELDINNLKQTGVYIGTYAGNPYYLVVIKYNETNIYQELIGLNFKKYRRFTTTWSEWIQEYSKENPIKAGDITGINIVDGDKELTLAMLEDTTFVKANIKYNPSTKSLYIGNEKFATEEFVRNAVNMIQSIIVSELPETGVENTIYFVPAGAEGGNIFNEYVYVNGDWEIVGGTSVDLTPFLTKEDAEKIYAKISSLDDKVSKTTTINGKTLYNNITLTADDVGALSKDTILVEDVVYRHTNEEISGKLTAGAFVENDLVIAIDSGTYLQGHMYKYNGGTLSDITDIITDYVDLNSDQNINGTKNFNGILRYGGVNVATDDDLNDYLPLTAGSTKPLTDDLYIASKKSLRLGNKAYLIGDDTDGRLTISPGKDRILTIRPNPDNSTGQMHIYGTVFRPGSKDGVQLGADSAPWSSIYGTTIYQDGKQVANKEDIPTASGQTVYDLVITTQQEFTDFYTSLDNGTCTAKSVLFVGDGGTLEFTRSDGKGLHLPETLLRLDGINNAIINIKNFTYNSSTNYAGIWYTNVNQSVKYSINDISVIVNSSSTASRCFYRCYQINNCSANSTTSTTFAYGFAQCYKLNNCSAKAQAKNAYSFTQCYQLNNCDANVTGTNTGIGFDTCYQINNGDIKNATGNTGYGFSGCKYISNCRASGTVTTSLLGGSNTYVDDTTVG